MKRKQQKRYPAQCKICGHKSPSHIGLTTHIRNVHHITAKEYFDIYIEPFQHKCIYCGSTNVKFKGTRIGYSKSCGSHDCEIKASKQTKLKNHGDENYSNREKFKHTIKQNKENDPQWQKNINDKVKATINKHKKEDPDYWHKRDLKSKATRKKRYNNEKYNGQDTLKKHLMEKYGVVNVFQLESVKEKCKQSHLKNLGVEYPMQSQKCLNKRVKTYIKNLGVDNPSKCKSCIDKAKQTNINLHGNPNYRNIEKQKQTNAKKTKQEKEAIVKKREKYNLKHYGVKTPLSLYTHRQSISKLSFRIKNILDANNISYEMEYKIKNDTNYRFYDFKIKNVILEINGDYYHANPQKYLANDVLTIHHIQYKAKDIWEFDNQKRILAENNGFIVKYLWEYDMKRMNDQEILQWIIQNIL